MNIFKTDPSPTKSAQSLPNKLVIKMPTELAQILSSKFSLERLAEPDCPRNKNGSPRRHFNPKHPSVKWAHQTRENFIWALDHGVALCDEYFQRYKIRHFQVEFFEWVRQNLDNISFQEEGLTPIALAMPDQYKVHSKDYLCYQSYINGEKSFSRWPSVEMIPDWWFDKSEKWVDKNFKNGLYTKR